MMVKIIKKNQIVATANSAQFEVNAQTAFSDKKSNFEALAVDVESTPELNILEPIPFAQLDPTQHPEWQFRLEEAEQLAYQRGLERGTEEASQTEATLRARFTGLLERIPRELDKSSNQIEEIAIQVALAATVRIVGEHVLDRSRAIESVRATLAEVRAESIHCLHLSPADYEYLELQKINQLDRRVIQIIPSKHVELGGCIIDTSSGSLDARFETQLQRIYEILRSTLERSVHE